MLYRSCMSEIICYQIKDNKPRHLMLVFPTLLSVVLLFHHASFYQQSLAEQAWYLQAWFICEQQYQERHGSLAYQKRREHKLHSKVNHQSNPLLEDHGLGVSTIWQWSLKQKEIPTECNLNNLMIRIALQWTVT